MVDSSGSPRLRDPCELRRRNQGITETLVSRENNVVQGGSGREHGEALLDPRAQGEKLKLLLAKALDLVAEPRRLASGLDGLLDQGLGDACSSGTRTLPRLKCDRSRRPGVATEAACCRHDPAVGRAGR